MKKVWIGTCLALVLACGAFALELPAAVDAASAFERIKGLAGDWTGKAGHASDSTEPLEVQYRVTAAGSAVMETQFAGTPHEMVSVYYRDGNDLVLTHYCAAGNQPRLRLDAAASKPDELRFVYAGGSNLDPAKDAHIHGALIRFVGADRLQSEWTSHMNGAPAETAHFELTRKPAAK